MRESVLLASRARRCRAAWAPHVAAVHAVVFEAMRGLPRYDLAVVLGSGPLADVPLPALARAFRRVRLVDAVHPWQARLAARAHPNVALATADLVASEAVARACAGADLVLSANLLSQLPIVPLDRTAARGLDPPPGLGARIVADHLAALDRAAGRVCLVADTIQREEDRAGTVLAELDLLHGIALPATPRAWDWELAPFGEAARHRRTVHRVRAYPDWAAARTERP